MQASTRASGGPEIEYGAIGLWVPVGAAVLMFFFVLLANPAHYPGTRLFKIVSITFLISALLAALESERLKDRARTMPETPFSGLTPASWFIVMLVGWPVAFPAFFYIHYLHHDKTLMTRAWKAAGAFMFMLLLCWAVVLFRGPNWSSGKTSSVKQRPSPTPVLKPASNPVQAPVAAQPVTSTTLTTSTLAAADGTSQPMPWFPLSGTEPPVQSTPTPSTTKPNKSPADQTQFGVAMPKRQGGKR